MKAEMMDGSQNCHTGGSRCRRSKARRPQIYENVSGEETRKRKAGKEAKI